MKTALIALALLLAACTTPQGQALQAAKERAMDEASAVADMLAADAYELVCNRLSYRAEVGLRLDKAIAADTFNAFCGRPASADQRRP